MGIVSGVWFWIPSFGPVRVSTVVGFVLVVSVIGVLRNDWLGGLAAAISWTAVFETVYHLVGIFGYHWPRANLFWGTAAVAGWVILAAHKGIWPDRWISLLFLAAMAVWIATGFHYNVAGQASPINVRDEILNETAKSLLGLAYLVGALRTQEKELVKALVHGNRGRGVRRRLHLERISPGRDRALADRVVPDKAITG